MYWKKKIPNTFKCALFDINGIGSTKYINNYKVNKEILVLYLVAFHAANIYVLSYYIQSVH